MFLKNPEPAHGTVCIPVPHFHPLHCSLPLPRTPFSHSITLPPIFFFPARRLQDPKISSPPPPCCNLSSVSTLSARGPPAPPLLPVGSGHGFARLPVHLPVLRRGYIRGRGETSGKLGKPSQKCLGGRGRGGSVPALSRPAANGRECRPRAAEGGSGWMGGCAFPELPLPVPACPQPVPCLSPASPCSRNMGSYSLPKRCFCLFTGL